MGEERRRMIGECNRARRDSQPIANWPTRIIAAVLLLVGTIAGVVIALHMEMEMWRAESAVSASPVPRCLAWGAGLGVLLFLSFWHSHVAVWSNDLKLFGWIRGDELSLLIPFVFAAIIGSVATAIVAFRPTEWFHGSFVVIGVFILLAWLPVYSRVNRRFRVTRRMRVLNYRIGFTRTIAGELARWDELYSIFRRFGILFNGAFALLLLLISLGMVVRVCYTDERLFVGWHGCWLVVCWIITTCLGVSAAIATKRGYDRKQQFIPRNKIRWGFNIVFTSCLGVVGCTILRFLAQSMIHLAGRPIGTVIVWGIGTVGVIGLYTTLILCLDRMQDEQEREEAIEQDEPARPSSREPMSRPMRSADSASVGELFAKHDEVVATTEDETTGG